MTLRDYWVSFDHREKDTDGGFDILKGKGLHFLLSDYMHLAQEKLTAGGSYLRLIRAQTGCKVILKYHNSVQALLWCFNNGSKPR